MTDREMLELAAKAAGLAWEWNACSGCIEHIPKGLRHYKAWNPLEDDGDAFRLAVKCDIAFGRSANTWWARWEFNDKAFRENAEKDGLQDPYAAARLAILRAAADIGKGMA